MELSKATLCPGYIEDTRSSKRCGKPSCSREPPVGGGGGCVLAWVSLSSALPAAQREDTFRRESEQPVCSGCEERKQCWLLCGSRLALMNICVMSFAQRHSAESVTTNPPPFQMCRRTPHRVWVESLMEFSQGS